MTDPFFIAYNRELAYLNRLVGEFAGNHPKIAERLMLTGEGSADANVSRLIQSCAFLNARTRYRLDDDYSELSDACLGQVSPQGVTSIPSLGVVQFTSLGRARTQEKAVHIDRHTEIESELVDDVACRFRTTSPVQLWPVNVRSARLGGPPFNLPQSIDVEDVQSVAELELVALNRGSRLDRLPIESLRFYIHARIEDALQLYELICNDTVCVVLSKGNDDNSPVVLDSSTVRPIGFGPDHQMLPAPPHASPAINSTLLSEFFAFPQRFLFFELGGIKPQHLTGAMSSLRISLCLRGALPRLYEPVGAGTFRLGCTPIVNLFSSQSLPVPIQTERATYSIVPDSHQRNAAEIYSIDRVTATTSTGRPIDCTPLSSPATAFNNKQPPVYWEATRRGWASGGAGNIPGPESDLLLTLHDGQTRGAEVSGGTLRVSLTCSNWRLPEQLSGGNRRPKMQFVSGAAAAQISCLTQLTPPRPVDLGSTWPLISQLCVNELSVSGGEQGAAALRELLEINRFDEIAATRFMVDSIRSVRSQHIVGAAAVHASGTFARGVEVAVNFDEQRCLPGGVFFMASLLDQLLSGYFAEHSFFRLVATSNQREFIKKWPSRPGTRSIL